MTRTARALLKAFDGLPKKDQREVAEQILRRSLKTSAPPLTDTELVRIAEETFLRLDREELENGKAG